MVVSLQRTVRRALVARLKADSGVIGLVPASSIHARVKVPWPLIKLSSPVTQRLRASCVNGAFVTWDIHAFAGPKKSGDQVVMYAEDHASEIGGAIEVCLADNRIDLEGGPRAKIQLSDIRLLEDGDQDSYHWFAQVNARVLAE